MPGVITRNSIDSVLVQPVFRAGVAPVTEAPTEASLEIQVRDLADQLGVPRPQTEWDSQFPGVSRLWRACKSAFSEWAQVDRRTHSLHLNSRRLHELDPNILLLVLAHMVSHLGKPEPEWVHDLRAMDVTGQRNLRFDSATVASIAHSSGARARALQFRCGPALVDYGIQISGDTDDDSESHFVFRASPYQKYP